MFFPWFNLVEKQSADSAERLYTDVRQDKGIDVILLRLYKKKRSPCSPCKGDPYDLYKGGRKVCQLSSFYRDTVREKERQDQEVKRG